MGEKRGMQALEAWCRQVTAGYNGVNVTNMTSSWKDGLAFCALVHHFRPDLIDFASLSPENVYDNNQLAFSVAENVLGIPALLDPEDMVNYVPDRLSIMTYLSQFYQVLAAPKNKGGMTVGLGRSVGEVPTLRDGPDSSSPGSKPPVKIFARQLLNEDGSPRPAGARRASDLCVSCQNPVFLAERFMVNGRLHHRVCFRCARCQSQLSLANYYETEQEQYCCETCPDEVCGPTISGGSVSSAPPADESIANVTPPPSPAIATTTPLISSRPEDGPPAVGGEHRSFLDSMVSTSEVISVNDVIVSPNQEDDQKISSPPVDATQEDDDDHHSEKTEDSQIVDPVIASIDDHQPDDSTRTDDNAVEETSQTSHLTDEPSLPVEQQESEDHVATVDEPTASDSNQPVINELDESNNNHVIATTEVDQDALSNSSRRASLERSVVQDNQPEDSSQPDGLLPSPVVTVVTPEGEAQEGESSPIVVPKPRRRKSKRQSTTPVPADKSVDYPEELNPFDDEPETAAAVPVKETSSVASGNTSLPLPDTPKKLLPAPKISLNPFGSDDEDDEETNSSSDPQSAEKVRPGRPPPPTLSPPSVTLLRPANPSPSPKKRLAPAPPPVTPPPKPQRTPSMVSESSSSTSTIRRKVAPPPPPPPSSPQQETQMSPVPAPRITVAIPTPKPRLISTSSTPDKAQKELSNLHLQSSANKDSHGQWKRKKGPAPPRPSPQKRKLRKLPLKEIQQELSDIEVKQIELERQGVNLEQAIRSVTEPEDGNGNVADGIHVEEMILRLFDLVNEKNELLRRQTELMYIRRQQRLEEEHAELEFQIRCLMDKPNGEKTDEDRLREEELIERLVHVVHRRAEIVDCLEMDRRRQAEEDESIQQHLDVFNSRGATAVETIDPSPPKSKSKGLKMIQSPIKLIKKDKLLKKSKKNKTDADKVDADKEADDSDPASPTQSTTSPPLRKDKSKTKSWFAK